MFQYVKKRRRPVGKVGEDVTAGWESLSLRRFFEIRDLPDGEDYDLQLVSILTGKPVDVLESMPLAAFQALKSRVAWIKNVPMPDIVERKFYTLAGVTLRASLDVRAWTASQYIDYQNLAGNTDTPEAVAALCSCYLVPVGHKYGDGYDFEAVRALLLEHLPALDAFALHNFFVFRSVRSITSGKTSWALVRAAKTKEQRREMKRLLQTLRDLLTSGDGFPSSTPLPKYAGLPGRRFLVWKLSSFFHPGRTFATRVKR